MLLEDVGPRVHPLPVRLDRLDELQVGSLGGFAGGPLEVGQGPERVLDPVALVVERAGSRSVGEAFDLVDDRVASRCSRCLP